MDGSAGRSARGVVLAVVGASGGCGASTLAAACALHAAESGWSVGVVDGAAGGAGIDVVLGIEHVPGVRWPDLAGCRGRVDGLGLLSRMPRAGAVAVLAHCRDSPAQIGADAVRGVFAGLVEVLDLVVVDVPRSWALQDWALRDWVLREAAVREAALLDFAPRRQRCRRCVRSSLRARGSLSWQRSRPRLQEWRLACPRPISCCAVGGCPDRSSTTLGQPSTCRSLACSTTTRASGGTWRAAYPRVVAVGHWPISRGRSWKRWAGIGARRPHDP